MQPAEIRASRALTTQDGRDQIVGIPPARNPCDYVCVCACARGVYECVSVYLSAGASERKIVRGNGRLSKNIAEAQQRLAISWRCIGGIVMAGSDRIYYIMIPPRRGKSGRCR